MAINSTGNMTADMATYYSRVFLEASVLKMQFYKSAQHKPLPLNEGQTVNFTRFLPLSTRTTALTQTTTGGIAEGSGKTMKSMTVSATVYPYGDFTEIHEMLRLASIDKNMKAKVEILGMQAAETIDELMMREYGDNCLRLRNDADATYQYDTVTTGAGSTTTMAASALTETNDFWNAGYVTITDRTNAAYGETRAITDFDSASDTLTVDAAFSTAPGTGCKFRITEGHALTASTDKLSHASMAYARRDLLNNNAIPFEGGYFRGLIEPHSEMDFSNESVMQGLSQQSSPQMLLDGEISRWLGFRLFRQNNVWRSAVDADSTYVATGAVRVLPFFGREALGAVDLAGQKEKIYVRGWRDLGQEIPNHSTIGWEIIFAQKMLNSCFSVGLMVNPTV